MISKVNNIVAFGNSCGACFLSILGYVCLIRVYLLLLDLFDFPQ